MDCLKIEIIATLLCVAMYASSADQQNSSNFLTNYARHQNICDKIGWEPKCEKGATRKEDCQGKAIVFHALLAKRLKNVPKDTIIKFENVEINQGNGYNPATGKFTAPVDGLYSFLWTYHIPKSEVYLYGYVNGKIRASIGSMPSNWQNTSGHFIGKLKKGDQFWIASFHGTAPLIHENYTYLSGYKINGC
ncbi:complement C1q tumor necrosis factor-related protein 3-like [Crassostrea angulata]|uniref:complement C1q tumor necrosis factor-related protein 3-like n=1 Tax=Magallana angulata TaxID=2784310 RepID=UPI0022B0F719|nr:complement C1q tumor necrosis factor-related protein 3-like [Crassostrea angulata]